MASSLPAGPDRDKQSFICPHCGVHAQHLPITVRTENGSGLGTNWSAQRCSLCRREILWTSVGGDWTMVFPLGVMGEPPSADMPARVSAIYDEARHVATLSRRSAAALLRLALQMLIDDLVPGAGDINTKIGRLVQRGLHPQIQQAMDVLRVVGNNAVHPGRIDLDEDPELVPGLFRLVNIVIDQMISVPKHAEGLFAGLPQQARDQVARRDGVSPAPPAA